MPSDTSPLDFLRRYYTAIAAGATGDTLAAFYTPDAVQEEFPNRLVPNGVTRDLAAILEGAERGQKVVSGQGYEIMDVIGSGEKLAVEVIWTATLAIPVGSIPAGGTMRARFAQFFELREGKIARQRNYDCFDPF